MASIRKRVTKNGRIRFQVEIRLKGHPRNHGVVRWTNRACGSGSMKENYFVSQFIDHALDVCP